MDDVQPVEQVLAERALRDHVAQVAVGGGDDPHVDATAGAIGADLLQLARLQEPQQQPLHAQRHLADFVEEDRALVGELELAGLVAIGAGEAALDVAEQLRFEQRLRKTGAVHGNERSQTARALRVHRVGDQFLTDAALAGDEHLGVGPRDALDLLLRARPSRCWFRSIGRSRCSSSLQPRARVHRKLTCRFDTAVTRPLAEEIHPTSPAAPPGY